MCSWEHLAGLDWLLFQCIIVCSSFLFLIMFSYPLSSRINSVNLVTNPIGYISLSCYLSCVTFFLPSDLLFNVILYWSQWWWYWLSIFIFTKIKEWAFSHTHYQNSLKPMIIKSIPFSTKLNLGALSISIHPYKLCTQQAAHSWWGTKHV